MHDKKQNCEEYHVIFALVHTTFADIEFCIPLSAFRNYNVYKMQYHCIIYIWFSIISAQHNIRVSGLTRFKHIFI